jgi:hypothetical protein
LSEPGGKSTVTKPRSYPVSSRVNQVQNDDAGCAEPVELKAPPQGQLFG